MGNLLKPELERSLSAYRGSGLTRSCLRGQRLCQCPPGARSHTQHQLGGLSSPHARHLRDGTVPFKPTTAVLGTATASARGQRPGARARPSAPEVAGESRGLRRLPAAPGDGPQKQVGRRLVPSRLSPAAARGRGAVRLSPELPPFHAVSRETLRRRGPSGGSGAGRGGAGRRKGREGGGCSHLRPGPPRSPGAAPRPAVGKCVTAGARLRQGGRFERRLGGSRWARSRR